MNKDNEQFEVRDLRQCTFFWIDHRIFTNYIKIIGKSGFIVYCSLAHHANNETQRAWPSVISITKETDVHRTTVQRCLKKLVACSLIKIKHREGKTSIYTLLEPKEGGRQNDRGCADAAPTRCTGAALTIRTKEKLKEHTVELRSVAATDSDDAALFENQNNKHNNTTLPCEPTETKTNKKVIRDAAKKRVKSKKMIITVFDAQMAKALFKIIREHKKIRINHNQWPDIFRRLRNDVKDATNNKEAKKRIEAAVKWYGEHINDEFVVTIESANAFRRKFTRLEDAMIKWNKEEGTYN